MKSQKRISVFLVFAVCLMCFYSCALDETKIDKSMALNESGVSSESGTSSTSSTSSESSELSESSGLDQSDTLDNSKIYNVSKDLEYEIKMAYAKTYWNVSDESDFDVNLVSMAFYGTYNGYAAVLNTGEGSAIFTPVEVGGYMFDFGTSNIILLYKDGQFIEFNKAFSEEKITQEDVDKLYEAYCNNSY